MHSFIDPISTISMNSLNYNIMFTREELGVFNKNPANRDWSHLESEQMCTKQCWVLPEEQACAV